MPKVTSTKEKGAQEPYKPRKADTVVDVFMKGHTEAILDTEGLISALDSLRTLCDEHGIRRISYRRIARALGLSLAVLTNGRPATTRAGRGLTWMIEGLFTKPQRFAGIGSVTSGHLVFLDKALRRNLECCVCYSTLPPIGSMHQTRFACHGNAICSACEARLYKCPMCRAMPKEATTIVLD